MDKEDPVHRRILRQLVNSKLASIETTSTKHNNLDNWNNKTKMDTQEYRKDIGFFHI